MYKLNIIINNSNVQFITPTVVSEREGFCHYVELTPAHSITLALIKSNNNAKIYNIYIKEKLNIFKIVKYWHYKHRIRNGVCIVYLKIIDKNCPIRNQAYFISRIKIVSTAAD